MSPSILIAFKNPKIDDPSACHSGMGVTALNSAMALREERISADARPVTNGEYLWAQLAAAWAGYSHVVLEAPYMDAAFLERLVRHFPMKQFALVYHSNLGFLSVDQFAARSLPAFLRLQASSPNFQMAGNSSELVTAIRSATGNGFLHLPNLYHLPHQTRRTRPLWAPGMPLHIGLFGAARVLKNWLTAGAAAMILQRQLQTPVSLHINSGRDEHAGSTRASLIDLVALNPDLHLVDVPWLAVDDFRRYLYGMDLLLQPSFTETFNNVAADGVACGVPCVVSDAIDWVPQSWMAKADSASNVAAIAVQILRDRKAAMTGWKSLDAYNTAALQAWRRWLNA